MAMGASGAGKACDAEGRKHGRMVQQNPQLSVVGTVLLDCWESNACREAPKPAKAIVITELYIIRKPRGDVIVSLSVSCDRI